MAKAAQQTQKSFRRNEQKWTPVLVEAGWSLIPNVVLEHQKALDLDAIDVNIILHLVRHWWFPGTLPFPSKRELANCMQIDISTVRRRIKKMEAANYIKRIPRSDPRYGQKTNEYDLSGLIDAATPFAEQMIREREEAKEKKAQRRNQLRPQLGVVAAS